jgi:hypothetical protein
VTKKSNNKIVLEVFTVVLPAIWYRECFYIFIADFKKEALGSGGL